MPLKKAPEAKSDKNTFKDRIEEPAIEHTKRDVLTHAEVVADEAREIMREDDKAKVENEETKKDPAEHTSLPNDVKTNLEDQVESQAHQQDPDLVQRESHNPTTESLTGSPVRQPVTIDPNTGQIHNAGEEAKLPGGTVAHEGDDAS
jgi:hypothetical protein